ncbi:OLC1v1015482C1 [Oldenlandia corymbosa var. corymbosa]|uniref:OLC1v1015482C1 n=1 Tax=Oldenlandia corymbosa var. corymbosa TaxID=529605 RepID=A0AAV1E6L9_OLDCO|nr:OLC1v1015482C1 [Oldenlandia corymbosa var. corymbosa]
MKKNQAAQNLEDNIEGGRKKVRRFDYKDSEKLRNQPNKNQVSWKLAKPIILEKNKVDNNVNSVFSPLSIHVVLGMIAAAESDEPARDRILSFLKSKSVDELNSSCSMFINSVLVDDSPTGGPLLSTANGIWTAEAETPPPDYVNVLEKVYEAHFGQADFKNKADEVLAEVNEWVDKETKGLIKNILPPGFVDGSTSLILANALYFKGVWHKKFDASLTKERDFYLLNGETVKAEFMTSWDDQRISDFEGFKVLSLLYRRGRGKDWNRSFSMYLYLPDAIDGLPSLADRISSEPKFVESHEGNSLVRVGDFFIPKFKVSLGFEASKILKDSGLVLRDGSQVIHKSFIEIDEQGTEAAAATVYGRRSCGGALPRPMKILDFVADHPFVFLLKENLNAKLSWNTTYTTELDGTITVQWDAPDGYLIIDRMLDFSELVDKVLSVIGVDREGLYIDFSLVWTERSGKRYRVHINDDNTVRFIYLCADKWPELYPEKVERTGHVYASTSARYWCRTSGGRTVEDNEDGDEDGDEDKDEDKDEDADEDEDVGGVESSDDEYVPSDEDSDDDTDFESSSSVPYVFDDISGWDKTLEEVENDGIKMWDGNPLTLGLDIHFANKPEAQAAVGEWNLVHGRTFR